MLVLVVVEELEDLELLLEQLQEVEHLQKAI